VHEIKGFLAATDAEPLTKAQSHGLLTAMYCLKERAKTLPELLEKKQLDNVSRGILSELTPQLQTVSWSRDTLEDLVSSVAAANDTKLGKLAGPLRAALAGRSVSPSVFDMMLVLGQDETVARLGDLAN